MLRRWRLQSQERRSRQDSSASHIMQSMGGLDVPLLEPSPTVSPIDTSAGALGYYSRRLVDKIMNAFHHACDQGEYDAARALLVVLETVVSAKVGRTSNDRRRDQEAVIAGYERLWVLLHPEVR
jgi:hypothetical protein